MKKNKALCRCMVIFLFVATLAVKDGSIPYDLNDPSKMVHRSTMSLQSDEEVLTRNKAVFSVDKIDEKMYDDTKLTYIYVRER